MSAPRNAALCDEHPPPVVIGTLREWRAMCTACPAVWRSDDPSTPLWVREHVQKPLGRWGFNSGG